MGVKESSTAYHVLAEVAPRHEGVPRGFQRTEVGVIPQDWQVVPLRELLAMPPSYGISAAAVPYDADLPTYIRITDIDETGRFSRNTLASVRHVASADYVLQPGDLVFARTGASVGKCYLYRKEDGVLVYAGFLIRVTPNPDKLDPSFLSAYVRTDGYWNWVRSNSMRSGQPGINGHQLSTLPVPLPPILEQGQISEAMSDVDSLVELLQQLIAKKRAIKHGAMQALLTGQQRLHGYAGPWKEFALGEIGVFHKGQGVTRAEARSGDLPCVRYGEIYTFHHNVIRRFGSWISDEVASRAMQIRKGDILFSGSGETKKDIGKCAAMVHEVIAYAGGDIVVFRPYEGDPVFYGYMLNADYVNEQKSARGQGDAVVHISASALSSVVIKLPAVEEQTAIATVLSDMDAEIDALEARLAKTRDLKAGMMQALLTGRIRLPLDEAA